MSCATLSLQPSFESLEDQTDNFEKPEIDRREIVRLLFETDFPEENEKSDDDFVPTEENDSESESEEENGPFEDEDEEGWVTEEDDENVGSQKGDELQANEKMAYQNHTFSMDEEKSKSDDEENPLQELIDILEENAEMEMNFGPIQTRSMTKNKL